MTRTEKSISVLYGIRADNLNLDDAYTKDKYDALTLAIKALEQEPKIGHWKAFIQNAYRGIDEDGEPIWKEVTVYHCSQCNRRTVIKDKFCPNCGTKMIDPQESEG